MRFAVACLPLVLASPVVIAAPQAGVFFNQSSTVYSEPVPIALYEDDLRGGEFPESGRHAVTFNRFELGFSFGQFELAYFIREDYAFEFNDETFALVYSGQNDLPIADGSEYTVFLKAQHIKADGWRLGYVLDIAPRGKLRFSLNYLQADDLLYGTVAGKVIVDDNDISGGNLAVMYYYQEDYILGRRLPRSSSGTGYSADLEADLQLTDSLSLVFKFHDIMGEIHWDEAPYSDLKIASTNTYYDSNGYAHREPMMTGKESYSNFKQPLPLHYEFSLTQALIAGFGITYGREQYDKVIFNRLFLNYELLPQVSLITGYDFTTRSTWLGLDASGFSLLFATDDYGLTQSHTLALRASGYWRF
jgi:hypothetical protein